MTKMTKEVMDVFNDPQALKVLATASADGTLNNVPIQSLTPIDNETLVFADMFTNKTKENLNATKKCCAVAFIVPTTQGITRAGTQATPVPSPAH